MRPPPTPTLHRLGLPLARSQLSFAPRPHILVTDVLVSS